MRSLRVHIDRLTLEGKSRAEGRRIVAALERHLGALANGAAPVRLERDPAPYSASADAIGRRIAAQVFHSIGGSRHA